MERTDKIVATALQISRKDALTLIKKGRISANGKVIKDAKTKLDENSAELFFDDKRIYYNKYVYIMMNKPKGVISASNSKDEKTVIEHHTYSMYGNVHYTIERISGHRIWHMDR